MEGLFLYSHKAGISLLMLSNKIKMKCIVVD